MFGCGRRWRGAGRWRRLRRRGLRPGRCCSRACRRQRRVVPAAPHARRRQTSTSARRPPPGPQQSSGWAAIRATGGTRSDLHRHRFEAPNNHPGEIASAAIHHGWGRDELLCVNADRVSVGCGGGRGALTEAKIRMGTGSPVALLASGRRTRPVVVAASTTVHGRPAQAAANCCCSLSWRARSSCRVR